MTEEQGPRIRDEKTTVSRMIKYYCQHKHTPENQDLCEDCTNLLVYAHNRLDYCQFGERKPTCRKCPVHCYNPSNREKIRAVMRFSGPRMAFRAPIDWIRHKLRERK